MYDATGKRRDPRPNHREIREARAILAQRFPALFLPQGSKEKRPVQLGVCAEIYNRAPDLNRKTVRIGVADYCGGLSYHRAIVKGGARFDLDGNPSGEVKDTEIAHSAAILAKVQKRAQT